MKILVIHGPNMNMLGIREKEIYGEKSYSDLIRYIRLCCREKKVKCDFFQSNCEGRIVTRIQKAYGRYDAVLINPAAFSHTSVAILDALRAVAIPYVEVHISDVNSREDFRKNLITASSACAMICGKGFEGYKEGIEEIIKISAM